MARWRRCGSGEGEVGAPVASGSGKIMAGCSASWGRGWCGRRRRGCGLRRGRRGRCEDAGELRRIPATLQETERGDVTEVHKDVWKRMEEAGGAGEFYIGRKRRRTAVEEVSSGEQSTQPGGAMGVGVLGK